MTGPDRRPPPAPPAAAWALFAIAAGVGVSLAALVASGPPILSRRWGLLGMLAAWAAAWAVAAAAAFRLPRRAGVVAILAAAAALRLAALAGPPTTSDDLFRYAWDGRVQAAGIDPYTAAPASATLARLRESWLWPSPAVCETLHRPPVCTRINRPLARTIYPPVAEGWFGVIYRLAGIGSRHKAWQVAGLVTEAGVLALLPVALNRWGRDPRWAGLYALSPAPVLEVVHEGHIDGLAIVAIVAALAVARGSPTWRRDVAFGVLIGAAALVKIYPAVLILALVGAGGTRRMVPVIRAGVTAAALTALAYFPHIVSVGPKVLGYLPGYLTEEHYTTGGRFLLAGLAHVPARAAGPVSVLAVAAVAAWVLLRRPEPPVAACLLLGAVLLAASPVQPWYAVTLLAVATVAGAPWWAAVAVAGYPYYFGIILDDRHATGHGQAAYAAALAVVVTAVALTSRRGGRCHAPGWDRTAQDGGGSAPGP